MRLRLTRRVPARTVPSSWAQGERYEAVEEVIGELSSPWSVSADTARAVARLVVEERRSRVLEFGAGMSSRIFAAALEEVGGGRLTSVEEHPAWCREEWARVEASPSVDAALVPADLRLTVDRRGVYYGYQQTREIAERGPYDLVFVDAPWVGYGRDGGLHAAAASVVTGGLIALDDAARSREQGTLRRWLLAYPELAIVANDPAIGRGLAILRWEQSPQRRAGLGGLVERWASGVHEATRNVRAIRKHEKRRGSDVGSQVGFLQALPN